MKDSKKLFFASAGLVICGIMKGSAPTVLNQSFDIGSFLTLSVIAIIVAVLGFIKHLKNK